MKKLIYKLTEEDLVAFQLYHIDTSETSKRMNKINRLLGPVLFIVSELIMLLITDSAVSGILFGILMAIATVLWYFYYPKYMKKRVKKYVRRMLKEGKNKGLDNEVALTIAEDKIVVNSLYQESTTKWSVVEKVTRDEAYIYIYLSSVNAIIIPMRAIGTDYEEEVYTYIRDCFYESYKKSS